MEDILIVFRKYLCFSPLILKYCSQTLKYHCNIPNYILNSLGFFYMYVYIIYMCVEFLQKIINVWSENYRRYIGVIYLFILIFYVDEFVENIYLCSHWRGYRSYYLCVWTNLNMLSISLNTYTYLKIRIS